MARSAAVARSGGHATASQRLEDAFRAEERAGLALATRARLVALAVVAIVLALLERPPAVYYYEAVIALLALSGVAHHVLTRRSRRPWAGYVAVTADAAILVYALIVLTAGTRGWPVAMAFRTAPVAYFFLLVAYVALTYSPRLMVWSGLASAAAWLGGVIWVARRPGTRAGLMTGRPADEMSLLHRDANFLDVSTRIEEVAVLLVSAGILALVVWRSRQLAIRQVRLARERTNLARYFSPTVVEELAGRDEPLGPVRRQDVAVLFVDIVDFTRMAETMAPEDVMALLREFHARAEREVFTHRGTLEKFIGDAMLATFGIPRPGPRDAVDALSCAFSLLSSLERWNEERSARGEPRIRIGLGAHFGPAVLGDIGSERNMAFAVVGDTINTASRLQTLTREIGCVGVVSDSLARAARGSGRVELVERLTDGGPQHVRGREEPIRVWLLRQEPG